VSARTVPQVTAATRAFFDALTPPVALAGTPPHPTFDQLPDFVRQTYVDAMTVALAAAEATPPGASTKRPWTADRHGDDGMVTTVHVKRACDGCGELIGDVTDAELDAALDGRRLPSVIDEHGCRS
jgi:hypothetical protein